MSVLVLLQDFLMVESHYLMVVLELVVVVGLLLSLFLQLMMIPFRFGFPFDLP